MEKVRKNREELKSYFRKGEIPKSEHFEALIDSMVIFEDDPLFASDERMKPFFEEKASEEDTPKEPTFTPEIHTVPADGEWHSLLLPVESSGCHAYKIFVSFYDAESDSYSMCIAMASHCNGRDCDITSADKHWWGWSGKMRLRWKTLNGKIHLQIRTKKNKIGVEHICYRICEEWNYIQSS